MADKPCNLTPKQLARELYQSERTLERWRQNGTGPRYIKCGRKILYSRSAIDEWQKSREFESTAAAKMAGCK